jgi:hypothetical protein
METIKQLDPNQGETASICIDQNDYNSEYLYESLKVSFPVAGTIIEAKNLPGCSAEKTVY